MFGGSDEASSVALPGDDTAIATVRVLEDAAIEHDARWVPGWRLADSDLILLSLDHFDQMMNEGALTGPAGGLRISYRSLEGHYLRGDGFVELVRSGYVGTRGATTEHLQALIEASLDGGKAVVAGIQSALESAAG